ncbi:MAG: glutaminase A [Rhodocyclaceae bacterium]|nr:glutaminase A [Rhodocyclaceae bacterium]
MNDPAPGRAAIDEVVHGSLEAVYRKCRDDTSGAVADYIPELARVDADRFGIAVATAEGRLWRFGDADDEFTMQSVSKCLVFCMALELLGRRQVFEFVGVEPSGDAFNAIVFDPHTGRPFNPMVNAGAITIAGLLYGALGDGAMPALLERLSRAAGRDLKVSEAVYVSERETGHRNRAIAHLLLNVGALSAPVEAVLDLYFRQCSILASAVDLARMGATLANIGKNPVTGDPVFDVAAVRDTLAVMFTCGMYDYSGHWAIDVGMPAKSGVGGGILGVVNRQLGIGTFSPRLDAKGNSVRGVEVCRRLADDLGLHAFECTNYGSSFVRGML